MLNEPDFARVVLVVSNSAKAPALLRARRAGVATLVSSPLNWTAIHRELQTRRVQRIFLAGFMRILPEDFVNQWQGRILNIHPSLLPAYPGLNSIERAYRDAADIGATVHEVTAVVDAGRVVAQGLVLEGQQAKKLSIEDVELRVHLEEHRLLRRAIRQGRGNS